MINRDSFYFTYKSHSIKESCSWQIQITNEGSFTQGKSIKRALPVLSS